MSGPTLEELVEAVLVRLSEEVRTHRLVVVDDDGVERIHTRHIDGSTELEVCTPAHADGSADCRVVLTAADGEWIRDAGLYVSAGGQIVAQFEGTCDVDDVPTILGGSRAAGGGAARLLAFPADSNHPTGHMEATPAGISWKAGE